MGFCRQKLVSAGCSGVLLLVMMISSFAHVIALVVTTTSVILSYDKIQNGDVLVPADPAPSPSGKWPLKWREKKLISAVPSV